MGLSSTPAIATHNFMLRWKCLTRRRLQKIQSTIVGFLVEPSLPTPEISRIQRTSLQLPLQVLIPHPYLRLTNGQEGLVAVWPLNCASGFNAIVGSGRGGGQMWFDLEKEPVRCNQFVPHQRHTGAGEVCGAICFGRSYPTRFRW